MFLDRASWRQHSEGAFQYRISEIGGSVDEPAQTQVGPDELDISAHRQA